jgi:hypothetical protein
VRNATLVQIVMKNLKEQPLEYRIIEYGITHGILVPKKFYAELAISDVDQRYVEGVLMSSRMDRVEPNQIMILVSESSSADKKEWQYRVAPTALFHYNDYLELIAAHESAMEAKRLSWIAIWISLGVGALSVVISSFQLYYQLR